MPTDPAATPPDGRAGGYPTETRYPWHYVRKTNPLFMRLALLDAGFLPPDIETACELGFGQGGNILLHAAAGTAQWLGNDINPDHVSHARELADAAELPLALYDDSFAEFAARPDLPDIDFIVVSGVWNWISDENRRTIVAFVRRHLRPGGVLYLGYSLVPGLAALAPVRHLMAAHARSAGSGRAVTERVHQSLDFIDRLLGTNPVFLQDHPRVSETLQKLRQWDVRDLAHDLLGQHWQPTNFDEVSALLTQAGLVHAGEANYGSTIASLQLNGGQRALLDGIADPVLRETTRDFLLQRSSRADYWMKPLTTVPAEAADALREERFILTADRPELPFEIRAPLKLQGLAHVDSTITALLALLAPRQTRCLGDIEIALADQVPRATIVEALSLLLHSRIVAPVQPELAVAHARTRAARFNEVALDRVDSDSAIRHLASPLLGGGFQVGLPEQLFLKARRAGERAPEKWARFAQQVLASLDVTGKEALTADQVAARAATFAATGLPLLQSLLVA